MRNEGFSFDFLVMMACALWAMLQVSFAKPVPYIGKQSWRDGEEEDGNNEEAGPKWTLITHRGGEEFCAKVGLPSREPPHIRVVGPRLIVRFTVLTRPDEPCTTLHDPLSELACMIL